MQNWAGVEPVSNQFQVNTFTANAQSEPSIGMDSNGNSVIAWTGQGQDQSFFNAVVAQQFDSNGNRLGSQITVDDDITQICYEPYVAVAHDGTFAVAWAQSLAAAMTGGAPNVQPFGIPGTVNPASRSGSSAPREPRWFRRLVGAGQDPSVSFDANDDYTVTADAYSDTDNDTLNSDGVYAAEYQLYSPRAPR